MKDYTEQLDDIYSKLYDLNNNLWLLIDILAQSSIEHEIIRN